MGLNDQKVPTLLINDSTYERQPLNPLLMFTFLRIMHLGKRWKIGTGTQLGFNPFEDTNKSSLDFASFSYINTRFLLIPKWEWCIYGGGYFGNSVDLGEKNQGNFMLGYEFPLKKDKLILQGDWIVGKHPAAFVVLGGVWFPTRHLALSFGWQLPSPNSGNPHGFVFELTID